MFKVVLYARTSTEEERQTRALETQVNELRELVKSNPEWKLIDEYIDQSSGTTSKGRGEFNRLIQDLSTDKFEIVIIKDQDRLMRDEYLWYMFRNELLGNSKRLFMKMEGRFYIPESDSLLTGIKAVIAAQYSRDLSRKMNQAHKTRMKKGTVVTSGKMWGYDQKDGRLIINEKEAEVVKYVFDNYIAGMGFRKIGDDLTSMGITSSNGTPFSLTTLKRMIRQEKYKGTLICGKKHKNFFTKNYENVPESEWVIHEDSENVHAIVSKELWEQANQVLKSKTNRQNYHCSYGTFNGLYPLSGKIVCGKCGAKYYHSITRIKRKDNSVYEFSSWMCKSYRSYGKKGKYGCDNPQIKEKVLEDIIKKTIFEFWKNRDECIKSVIDILKETVETEPKYNFSQNIIDEINKLKLKREKVLELYTDDLISKEECKQKSNEILEQIEKLTIKLEESQVNKSESQSKIERLNRIKDVLNIELSSPEGISDELMETLVKEIILHPSGKIDIILDSYLGEEENHHIVATSGQAGHSYRGILGKI
jgi:Site-specific recombinases, DNA invertase Pin homologs